MSDGEIDAIWREPVRGGYPHPSSLALSGLDRLAYFRTGGGPAPPLFHLTGARPTGYGDGTAEAEMPATGWLTNDAGLISGGTLAILADIGFGLAVQTQLPARVPYTTAELSLSFLRPARPGAMLTAHGQAIHVGRSVGLAEVFILDPRDGETMLAHGTSRLSILPEVHELPDPPESPDPPAPEPATPDPFQRPAPADTVLPASIWSELAGREILERHLRGELPAPGLHHLTGIEPTEIGDGTATVRMPASEWLNSPAGRLQGGTIVMLADTSMLTAVLTTAPAGTAIAGLDLKANFLRPAFGDGSELTARATVEHRGRTLAIARTTVTGADGRAVMLATGTAMYLPAGAAGLAADGELGP